MPSTFTWSITTAALIVICVMSAYLLTIGSEATLGDFTNEPNSSTETPYIDTTTTMNPQRGLRYFFSSESYTWENARSYCKALQSGAKLAEFQSKKEYQDAVDYIMRNTGGGTFWIGGIYKRERWEWADGGLVDESISTWPGTPPRFTSSSRLSLLLQSQWDVYWNSIPTTQPNRLLCQMYL